MEKKDTTFAVIGCGQFGGSVVEELARQGADVLAIDNNEEVIKFAGDNNLGVIAYGALSGGILSGKYKERPTFAPDDKRSLFYDAFDAAKWDKNALFVGKLSEIAANNGKPIPHIAINWLNQQDAVTTSLVGARTPQQAIENANAGEWELSKDEIDYINQAYSEIYG